MKVLHVIPAIAERDGGPSRAVLEMGRVLQDRGIESLIATTDADGAGRLPVERGRAFLYRGVPTIFFSRQWSQAFKYSRPLARWLDEGVSRFDVVHIHAVFSHACLAAARACRGRRVPYVIRPLGSLDPWSLRQKRLRKRLLWHLGVGRMLRAAAALHYTTTAERGLAERRLGLGRGVVIPLGVEEGLLKGPPAPSSLRHRNAELEKNPYVLVLARLHPKKGLELLLDTFSDLTGEGEFRHWRLVVAGEGETGYVTGLRRRVEARGGDGRIVFTGWLDGADKMAVLQGAALLALPSHQENFGLSVVEALACGVPVLVSEHVNLAEDVRAARAGWVVSLEEASLRETLAGALRDEGERACRGSAGQELVRSRFTWPAVATQLVELYGAVTRRASHPER